MTTVAVLGTGRMGGAIARRLKRGGFQIFWVLTRAAPGLKAREAGFVGDVHEPTMFAMRDMLKDLDLGLPLYQPAPLTSLTRELFARVAAKAPDLDISAIVNAYSKEAAS